MRNPRHFNPAATIYVVRKNGRAAFFTSRGSCDDLSGVYRTLRRVSVDFRAVDEDWLDSLRCSTRSVASCIHTWGLDWDQIPADIRARIR